MSFLFISFLWTLGFLSIPIIIAFWNRRKFKKEKFGGFYLLKKITEATTRRVQILEILRLLNRLVLLTSLIFLFAEPFQMRKTIGEAESGFAVLIDVGRSLQTLTKVQQARVYKILQSIPTQSQGAIAFVSNRCEIASMEGGRQTARPAEWIDHLKTRDWLYSGRSTQTQALQLCLSHLQGLFSGRKIYTVFVSPLPQSLDQKQLEEMSLSIEKLSAPEIPALEKVDLRQESQGGTLRIFLNSSEAMSANVIVNGKFEPLGEIKETIDLIPQDSSFLLLEGAKTADPWAHQYLFPLKAQISRQVTLWAQKESAGYLSLLSALRSHSQIKVVKQIGGSPQGDAVLIYGNYPLSDEILGRAFFFVNPEGQAPWAIRDKKQLSSSSLASPDLLKSFRFNTPQGSVMIKRYVLLDPDRFETLSTFEDGAPSLLRDRRVQARHWILPFDLEDLTTDLSLEPSFIPYLYTHLETWLGAQDEASADEELKPVWLMAGLSAPAQEVIARLEWPGIYASQNRFKVVQADAFPSGFLEMKESRSTSKEREEKHFLRSLIEKILVCSIFIELLFSILLRPVVLVLLVSLFSSQALEAVSTRPIPIGYAKGSDKDRVVALSQILRDADRLSNLDFDKPQEASPETYWKYPLVVVSLNSSFGPFSALDRSRIRAYCEQGGVLFFDDPLATADSSFYKSVRDELSKIFPGRDLKDISKEDVIFRTYYLLNEVSGRKLASPQLQGLSFDNRWLAIFSSNDLLGANLRGPQGDYALSVAPYGISQRVLAQRMLMNFLMYSVTIDYKDDSIHLPHILKRRVK